MTQTFTYQTTRTQVYLRRSTISPSLKFDNSYSKENVDKVSRFNFPFNLDCIMASGSRLRNWTLYVRFA